MVNPYRRGLGLGGRGEPMPYTGGGSARPLEPYRGGGRAVQLEDDPYADPSRTPPTYGDSGVGESTYAYGRASGPGNKGGEAQKRRIRPRTGGGESWNDFYKHRTQQDPTDKEFYDEEQQRRDDGSLDPERRKLRSQFYQEMQDEFNNLPPATSAEDEAPYLDVSSSGLDAMIERMKKRGRQMGLSDEEIDAIVGDLIGYND